MYEFIIVTQTCLWLAYCKAIFGCTCTSLCSSASKEVPVSSVSQPLCSVVSCKPVSAAPECTSFSDTAVLKMYDTVFMGNGDPDMICSRLAWQLFTRSDNFYQKGSVLFTGWHGWKKAVKVCVCSLSSMKVVSELWWAWTKKFNCWT